MDNFKQAQKVEKTEQEVLNDLCNRIRNALEIDYETSTISRSFNADNKFIVANWKKMGNIVMPFVAGGVAIEGPQTTVQNAFKIGYYLGSLKSKHTEEIEALKKQYPEIKELF
jgi:hypothetical protein